MAFSYRCFVTLLILLAFSPFERGPVLITGADDPLLSVFEKWMTDYGRSYGSLTEKLQRFQVFKDNFQFIESTNNQPGLTYTLGLNKFSDLTHEEFLRSYTTNRSDDSSKTSTSFQYANLASIPTSVDWRTLGAVTPIKDQGQCGCCWAFSAIASIEGITQITTSDLISLSEQELVDCDTNSYGCDGGYTYLSFQWVAENGITTGENYPYISGITEIQGSCNYSKINDYAATITGYEFVTTYNETALANAVANQPVSISIDASDYTFQHYASGIYSGPCGTDLNHAVNIVGYDTYDGVNYWIVKNSWGTSWGASGYILMQKDISDTAGLCGLAIRPSYPTK